MAKSILALARSKLSRRRKSFKHSKRKSKPMARRRRSSSRRGSSLGLGKIGGFFKSGIVQKASLSLGAGTLAALLASRFSPQNTQLASLGGSFLAGGIEGTIAAEVVKSLAGAPSALSGVFGGGQQSQGAGFA